MSRSPHPTFEVKSEEHPETSSEKQLEPTVGDIKDGPFALAVGKEEEKLDDTFVEDVGSDGTVVGNEAATPEKKREEGEEKRDELKEEEGDEVKEDDGKDDEINEDDDEVKYLDVEDVNESSQEETDEISALDQVDYDGMISELPNNLL